MNQKKKTIIETSISLFAEKGFHPTSIQEIADKSGLSKGAFYLHFRSKDELMLRIFEYYYHLMNEKVQEVKNSSLPPKENFIKQIEVRFTEILKHKDFIITQFREQAISLNKELVEFIRYKDIEIHKWYEENLLNIYGEKIKPYVIDTGIIMEGINNSYLQFLISFDVNLDLHRLASFIMDRVEEFVEGMLSGKEEPLITKEDIGPTLADIKFPEEHLKQEVEGSLAEMENILNGLDLDKNKANELQGVIDFLLSEVKKSEPKEFLLQGLLANFKGIRELDKHRKFIADRLDIRLL